MRKHLLFVYGTLRRGGVNEITISHARAVFVGAASVRGRLHDMGGYPAVILDDAAGGIAGEVFEIDDAILAALDRFEAADDYHREQIEVLLNGTASRSWIYRPEPELCAGKPTVETGDWIEYSKLADGTLTNSRKDLS
jgi:gamma-glutamylcyclotransferase (GGCT)/AIG2-like uncharacterized protein YtfP